jgi:2-iminobutanoate/2-iminopropanoate deaminase
MSRTIYTADAPKPAGHYSQGIVENGWLFVSGQLPIDPASGQFVPGTIEEQTRRVLDNMAAVVIAAGGSLRDIAKVTLYFSDIAYWPAINAVYAEFFGDHKPARSAVPTQKLHYGADVEADAIAFVKG